MNPPAIKAIPAGGEATQELAEIYSGLFRHIQYRSNATHVFANAVYYAVACGIGHFRLVTNYVDDDAFDQEILIKRIQHPLSVFWAPGAVEPDRSDAEYCLVTELVGRKEFQKRFPDAAMSDFAAPGPQRGKRPLLGQPRRRAGLRILGEAPARAHRRAAGDRGNHRHYRCGCDRALPFSPRRWCCNCLSDRRRAQGEVAQGRALPVERRGGAGRPDRMARALHSDFPDNRLETALETKVIRSGLIRFTRDPQQLYNFWRSAAAEAIALAPRSPFVATPAMIAKFKGQWDTQNTVSRPYLLYEPDPDAPGGRPMREPPPDIPAALVNESATASDEMKATTGIYDAALGARSNEISGIAIRARESQGGVSAMHYQDNLMATLNHLGKVLIDLVPKIYDSERTVRIMREDETHIPVRINIPAMDVDGKPMLLNDLSQGTYDVRVKIGPSYATRRAEAADSMLQFIQAVPQAAAIAGDLVARNMDWPGADEIAERLKRMLPPQVTGEAPPLDAQIAQVQQQAYQEALAQAHLNRAQGLAAKSEADAVKAHAEAQDAASRAASNAAAILFGTPLTPEGQLKTALQEADLRERQASAAKTEAELQSKVFDNEMKRAGLTETSPYKL